MERVKSGVEGLDSIIEGGIPKNSITLVSGPPGSGKSIFCFQFIYTGVQNGEKCLFLTLDKKVEGLLTLAKELEFDFQPFIEKKFIKFLYLDLNKKFVYEVITNEVLSGDYDRVVLDSITPLAEMPIVTTRPELVSDASLIDEEDFSKRDTISIKRFHIRFVMTALETAKCTAVVTSELPLNSPHLSRDSISEFLADAVILLNFDPSMDRRKLTVMKMRGTKHTLKPHDIEIGKDGIKFR